MVPGPSLTAKKPGCSTVYVRRGGQQPEYTQGETAQCRARHPRFRTYTCTKHHSEGNNFETLGIGAFQVTVLVDSKSNSSSNKPCWQK
jgi:hypothetical protein